jgi:hypothetical protein
MYRFSAIVEIDTEQALQAETVRRKMQAAMTTSFQGATYPIKAALSPVQRVGVILPASEMPKEIVTP